MFRARRPRAGVEAWLVRLQKYLAHAGVRQILHRARERFAKLLLAEVQSSLDTLVCERVEAELVDVGLLEYCRPALEACGGRS